MGQAVGAVYDRAFGPLVCESCAVIDRAYSKNAAPACLERFTQRKDPRPACLSVRNVRSEIDAILFREVET